MKTNKTNYLFIRVLLLVAFTISATNSSYAASQGKLGKQSSASVQISVHVNQSLSTTGPEEILLNQNKTNPLCIMHNGYEQNASVPYELKVSEIKMLTNSHMNDEATTSSTPTLDIYLEDQKSNKQKYQLSPGLSLFNQTRLNRNQYQDCQKNGMQLSVEIASDFMHAANQQNYSAGLLILLVSPD